MTAYIAVGGENSHTVQRNCWRRQLTYLLAAATAYIPVSGGGLCCFLGIPDGLHFGVVGANLCTDKTDVHDRIWKETNLEPKMINNLIDHT